MKIRFLNHTSIFRSRSSRVVETAADHRCAAHRGEMLCRRPSIESIARCWQLMPKVLVFVSSRRLSRSRPWAVQRAPARPHAGPGAACRRRAPAGAGADRHRVVLRAAAAPAAEPAAGLDRAVVAVHLRRSRIVEGALLDEELQAPRAGVRRGPARPSLMQLRRRADQRGFVVVGYMPAPARKCWSTPSKVLHADVPQLRAHRQGTRASTRSSSRWTTAAASSRCASCSTAASPASRSSTS